MMEEETGDANTLHPSPNRNSNSNSSSSITNADCPTTEPKIATTSHSNTNNTTGIIKNQDFPHIHDEADARTTLSSSYENKKTNTIETTDTIQEENNNTTKNSQHIENNVSPPELPLEWTKLVPDASDLPPIRYPSDVMEFPSDETYLQIIGTAGQKITHMGKDLMKQVSPEITHLILRSHLIHKMEGIRGMHNLELLELYDNQVEYLEELGGDDDDAGGIGTGYNLKTLDMSYNVIRSMEPVHFCPNVVELCK